EDDNEDKNSEHTQEGDLVARCQIEDFSAQPGPCCPSKTTRNCDKTINFSKMSTLKQVCRTGGKDGCNGSIAQPEKDGVSVKKPTMVSPETHKAKDA
ncbi:MAG: hypothetical protein GWN86_21420, partial [Desulfobacterales bacterium]|nr:hypothetical protein [Desulfobacterales bacterium]